mgnify:CR=1 FL=1
MTILSVAVLALTACTEPNNHTVKILAHRGNASTGSEFTTDENSLDALRRAQEGGFAGIEFDVHITADDQLVIHHDNKIAPGLTCQGSTFDEIRAHKLPFGHQIPTLREWLEQAKKTPEIKQLLEIKSHKAEGREAELIRKSLEIIRELDMVEQMYMLSFKTETVDEVLRQEPNMRVVLNSSSLHHSLTPAEVKERGYHAVSYNILNDIRDAEECVNDTYIGAWNAIPPTIPHNLTAFLCRITRNLSLKRLEAMTRQKRAQMTLVSFDELAEILPDENIAYGISDEELGKAISDFLRMEKESARNVFIRKYYFFDSVKEIAERYSFTESKVKNMLFYTRNKLRDYLIKEGVEI